MGVLTVLTLGIYRFWMKTRLRRWYWSGTRIGGHPLEYVGDPFEKLLGFLIAVVILAFYIGVVNLLLMFASFSLFQDNVAAYFASFAGVVPIWFFAQYRARRYVLARSRWRGLRFGLEPGAWGYALRALWYWGLTIVSAGLLWPLMTYRLEQYRTDRTFFGDTRLRQGGRWTMLYGSMRWLFVAGIAGAAAAVALASESWPAGISLALLAGVLALFGLVYYRVDSLRRLTATKSLGEARLSLEARPMRVLLILFFGYLLAGIVVSMPAGVLGFMILAVQAAETLGDLGLQDVPFTTEGLNRWVMVGISVLLYFAIFLLWSALTHALVTMPVWRHYADGLTLHRPETLDAVRQRPRDAHTEAEGFAEALDVGASL